LINVKIGFIEQNILFSAFSRKQIPAGIIRVIRVPICEGEKDGEGARGRKKGEGAMVRQAHQQVRPGPTAPQVAQYMILTTCMAT